MTVDKKTVQELLTTSDGTAGSLLIPKKIWSSMIESVDKKRIPRELARMIMGPGDIPGSDIDVNLQTADSMQVYLVAEGAGVPIDVQEYTNINFKPLKYGVRPLITKEMIEDSQFALMEMNIREAGREMADNETELIIADALDSASTTVAGGAAVTIANIVAGMKGIEDNDFRPTDFMVGTEVLSDLRNIPEFLHANKFGDDTMIKTGFVGTIYGMKVWVISANLLTSTTAYMIDRTQAYGIAEKRPLTINNYNDVVNDMSGAVATHRIKVKDLRAGAITKITSS